MNIVGFNFTKIVAERQRSMVGQVKINNNIHLLGLSEAKIGIGEGAKQALKMTFSFTSEYEPKMAILRMDGDVLILLDKKNAQKVLADWEKDKKLPPGVASRTMNYILEKCNIQGLLLAKDLNLPSPVPLPRVNVKQPIKKVAKKKKKK